MFRFDKRILSHFDFLIIILIIPIVTLSYSLVSEVSQLLSNKQLVYFIAGFGFFIISFLVPIRNISWIIPHIYWTGIVLLLLVDVVGVSKLGATRWLSIPFTHFTIQPSELFKPAFLLMLAYKVTQTPPDRDGYNLKEFVKLSGYILLPFLIIAKEPDLGTAVILLMVGFGILFVIGVNWRIWASLSIVIAISSPMLYLGLKDYQKKRINDFVSEKPSYHVQQSIIAIGSGGLNGKNVEDATQAQLQFLPIATSDFIFASLVERHGFFGALGLIVMYALLILHLLTINYSVDEEDYFLQVLTTGIAMLIFVYMGVNIAMTIGLAPVVGVPLPFFSYGGSSFSTFMVLFGILQNLLAFRFLYLYKQ